MKSKRILARAIAFAMTAVMAMGNGTISSYAMYSNSAQSTDVDTSSGLLEEETIYYDLPTAMNATEVISMNQESVTVDKYDKFLLDGNTDINYAESAKMFKLPKGYYIMEMTMDLTTDMSENGNYPTVYFFNDQNYQWQRTIMPPSRTENGKIIYTFMVEEYYANGCTPAEAISYIWISNLPENTTAALSWTTPQELSSMKKSCYRAYCE